jgi:hypothetical protein
MGNLFFMSGRRGLGRPSPKCSNNLAFGRKWPINDEVRKQVAEGPLALSWGKVSCRRISARHDLGVGRESLIVDPKYIQFDYCRMLGSMVNTEMPWLRFTLMPAL